MPVLARPLSIFIDGTYFVLYELHVGSTQGSSSKSNSVKSMLISDKKKRAYSSTSWRVSHFYQLHAASCCSLIRSCCDS